MLSLLLPAAFILAAGLTVISAVSRQLFVLQLTWAFISLGIIVVFLKIDWRVILNYRWVTYGLYVLTVFLLLLAAIAGPVIRNTRSWLVLGPLNFQPVELAKISLILVYARYFSRRHLAVARLRNMLASFLYFLLPGAIVFAEPDLGSALILFGIWFGFLLVSGLPWRRVAGALLIFTVLGVLGWQGLLKNYQRERITGFLYPQEKILGINYSVTQSKIAIGSAGLWGKGYRQGTETQLGFLTEPANDFILAALIEEWGLLAGLLMVIIFLYLIYAILKVGIISDQNFEKFICLGATIVFGIQFMLNAGSTVGLLPVVGVTWPFFSYGGSSLLTSSFLLAIVNSIARRR